MTYQALGWCGGQTILVGVIDRREATTSVRTKTKNHYTINSGRNADAYILVECLSFIQFILDVFIEKDTNNNNKYCFIFFLKTAKNNTSNNKSRHKPNV